MPKKDPEWLMHEEIEAAAKEGRLPSLPKEYLTLENLSRQDSTGKNPLHIAASWGKIGEVPKEFLTPELLTVKDNSDMTVIHHAADAKDIDKIPKEILTMGNLTLKDEHGWTTYHHLANQCCLSQLDPKLITEEVILQKNNYDKDVLDIAIFSEVKEILGNSKDAPDESQMLTTLLSEKALKNIIKEEKGKKSGYAYGTRKAPNSKKLEICRKELLRKSMLKKFLKEKEVNTLEL